MSPAVNTRNLVVFGLGISIAGGLLGMMVIAVFLGAFFLAAWAAVFFVASVPIVAARGSWAAMHPPAEADLEELTSIAIKQHPGILTLESSAARDPEQRRRSSLSHPSAA